MATCVWRRCRCPALIPCQVVQAVRLHRRRAAFFRAQAVVLQAREGAAAAGGRR